MGLIQKWLLGGVIALVVLLGGILLYQNYEINNLRKDVVAQADIIQEQVQDIRDLEDRSARVEAAQKALSDSQIAQKKRQEEINDFLKEQEALGESNGTAMVGDPVIGARIDSLREFVESKRR